MVSAENFTHRVQDPFQDGLLFRIQRRRGRGPAEASVSACPSAARNNTSLFPDDESPSKPGIHYSTICGSQDGHRVSWRLLWISGEFHLPFSPPLCFCGLEKPLLAQWFPHTLSVVFCDSFASSGPFSRDDTSWDASSCCLPRRACPSGRAQLSARVISWSCAIRLHHSVHGRARDLRRRLQATAVSPLSLPRKCR